MINEKKLKIINATVKVCLENGIDNSTTAKIASTAKMAHGTIFNYFPNKESLMKETDLYIKQEMNQEIIKLNNFFKLNFEEQIKKSFEIYINWYVDNEEYFRFHIMMSHSSYAIKNQKVEDVNAKEAFVNSLIQLYPTIEKEIAYICWSYYINIIRTTSLEIIDNNINDREIFIDNAVKFVMSGINSISDKK